MGQQLHNGHGRFIVEVSNQIWQARLVGLL